MKRTYIVLLVIIAIIATIAILIFLFRQQITSFLFRPTADTAVERVMPDEAQLEVFAENLNVPWSIALLPDGEALVSERSGTVQRIGERSFTFEVADVAVQGEGGLLGLALDPDFNDNQFVYLYKTTTSDNRIERYRLTDTGLINPEVVFTGIPESRNHNGGRIAFGPDGMLYIATGDAGDENLAQDRDSLAGKILRITPKGEISADNPFGSAVYSYGHRNVQGLAWDDEGVLWATEHGRSGAATGYDELNRIVPGGNYGWPVIQGDETFADMYAPVIQSGPETTWAPGSLAYGDGTFYFGGLRGQSLYAVTQDGDGVDNLRAYFAEEYGRIRDVVVRDDWLYFTTSNTDGRGTPQAGDDKILRIPLSQITTN